MKYADRQQVQVGDRVGLGGDTGGVVLCSIEDGVFSDGYPTAWASSMCLDHIDHLWSHLDHR